MRFGLPTQCVTTAPNLSMPPILLEAAPQPKPKPAIDSLNDALARLDSMFLLKISSIEQKLENERIASLLSSRGHSLIGALDLLFEHQLKSLQLGVEATIEAHEKKKRDAEEKARLIEEKARLELEKSKREEEKARLEEEKKRQEELARKAQQEKELKAKEAAEKAAQEEKRLRDLKDKELQEKKANDEAARASKGFTNVKSVEAEYLKYYERIPLIKSTVVQELAKNPDLKRSVGAYKRKLNVKFGQLSNSMTQLRSITSQMVELINACKGDQLAYKWILNFVSKSIVSQAESEVTVKPSAALPLARLAVSLLHQCEGLDYYLSARFVKKCPLIVGYSADLTTEKGRNTMGWKRVDDAWENEVKFEERVGGILSLWAVMAREETSGKFPLFSLGAQWTFVARVLNCQTDLLLDVHFVMLCNWWEASAERFVAAYLSQANKILKLLSVDFAAIGSLKSFAAATRLQVLGEDLAERRKYNTLKEMEA